MTPQSDGANRKPRTQIDKEPTREFTFSATTEMKETGAQMAYLIPGLLAAGQPCIIGKPKSLHSTLMHEMAFSLASGTEALGKFRVPRKVHVTLVNGETN